MQNYTVDQNGNLVDADGNIVPQQGKKVAASDLGFKSANKGAAYQNPGVNGDLAISGNRGDLPVGGYQNPGMQGQLGDLDAARRRQLEAFEATMAPARSVPKTYDSTKDITQSGSYQQVGNKLVNSDDLGKLAQSGDIDAMKAYRDEMVNMAKAEANATRMPGIAHSNPGDMFYDPQAVAQQQMAQQNARDRIVGSAENAFAQMMGLGNQAFTGDTERAKAAIEEMKGKVNEPQRLASEEARAKQQSDTQLAVAGMNVKAMLKTEHMKERQAAIARGATPAELDAIEKRQIADEANFSKEFKSQAGGVKIDQPPSDIKMQGQTETPREIEQRERRKSETMNALIQDAFGSSSSQGKESRGSVDKDRIAKAIGKYSDSIDAGTFDAMKAYADKIGEGDKFMQALRDIRITKGQASGKGDDAFQFKVKRGSGNMVYNPVDLVAPGGGVITGRSESTGYIPSAIGGVGSAAAAALAALAGGAALPSASAATGVTLPTATGATKALGGAGALSGLSALLTRGNRAASGTADLLPTLSPAAQDEAMKQAKAAESLMMYELEKRSKGLR